MLCVQHLWIPHTVIMFEVFATEDKETRKNKVADAHKLFTKLLSFPLGTVCNHLLPFLSHFVSFECSGLQYSTVSIYYLNTT